MNRVPDVAPDGEILDLVEPADQIAQFGQEARPPRRQVRAGLEQAPVPGQLQPRAEQQYRDRLRAAQSALGHVLAAEAERLAGDLSGRRVGRRLVVDQHVGDDPVGLDEVASIME